MNELFLNTKNTKTFLKRAITDSVKRFKEKRKSAMSYSLAGKPGISKTAIANNVKNILEEVTGTKVNSYSLRPAERGLDFNSIMGKARTEYLTEELGWIRQENHRGEMVLDTRTKYSPPGWLKDLEETEFSVLIIDDITRGLGPIVNSLMGLLEDRGFADWKLPPGCFVVATYNNDEDSQVEIIFDKAQESRVVNINVTEVDINDWYEDFAKGNLNELFAEFVYSFWSEINEGVEGNIRSLTKFGFNIDYLLDEYVELQKSEAKREDLLQILTPIAWFGRSTVGESTTQFFIDHYLKNTLKDMPDIKHIFKTQTPLHVVSAVSEYINKHKEKSIILMNIFYLRLFNMIDEIESERIGDFFDVINSGDFLKQVTTKAYWANKIFSSKDKKYALLLKHPKIATLLSQ